MKATFKISAMLITGVLALTAPSSASIIIYEFTLSAAEEVPTNLSPATGFASVTLNTETKELSWNVQFENLTTGLSGAHFHGPAAIGVNMGVLLGMSLGDASGQTSGVLIGAATQFTTPALTDTTIAHMLAGNTYINLHTVANLGDPNSGFPGGEIRGQVIPEPGTYALFAGMLALAGVVWFRRRRG